MGSSCGFNLPTESSVIPSSSRNEDDDRELRQSEESSPAKNVYQCKIPYSRPPIELHRTISLLTLPPPMLPTPCRPVPFCLSEVTSGLRRPLVCESDLPVPAMLDRWRRWVEVGADTRSISEQPFADYHLKDRRSNGFAVVDQQSNFHFQVAEHVGFNEVFSSSKNVASRSTKGVNHDRAVVLESTGINAKDGANSNRAVSDVKFVKASGCKLARYEAHREEEFAETKNKRKSLRTLLHSLERKMKNIASGVGSLCSKLKRRVIKRSADKD